MKVDKKVSMGLPYAKKKAYEYQGTKFEADLKDQDIVKVLDGGQKVVGQYGEQNVFKIRTRNGDKLFAMNQASINNLIDEFGDETEEWVDQDVKVWTIKAMVSGKLSTVVYFSGLDAEMDEDGRFSRKGRVGAEVDTIEYPEDDDVPNFDEIGA